MTPQKKIRVGAGFVAIWVLLGGAWLCDYFFGGTEFWKLASGELTVLLGIGAGTAMLREGRRGQEAVNAAAKDAGAGKQAAEETRTGETQTGNTAAKDAGIAGPAVGETQAPETRRAKARQHARRGSRKRKNDKHRATRKRIPSRNCGSAEGPENLTL